jgi:hypothetical protein
MRRNWKRWLLAVFLGLCLMFGDAALLAVTGKLYGRGRRPPWLTAAIYYFLAWPLFFTQHVFPRASEDTDGGPTFLAVASAGLVDLIIFTLLFYALLTWRARRRQRA